MIKPNNEGVNEREAPKNRHDSRRVKTSGASRIEYLEASAALGAVAWNQLNPWVCTVVREKTKLSASL